MAKILVKSTFPQSDGWGRAARDYLKAFTLTGHDIRANPIVLSQSVIPPEELPDWIPEGGQGFKPDVYFQQCLPEYFERFDGMKNIGFSFTETRHLEKTGWIENFNNMDEVWVATPQEKDNLEESGVSVPIKVLRMPMGFLECSDKLTDLSDIVQGKFVFYTIGEWVPRKNINDLLLAYWREFKPEDNTLLIIKTNLGQVKPEDLSNHIKQQIDNLQKTYRLYEYSHHYPEVMILTENMSDTDICRLHNTGHCFISASYGESTCRPRIDAGFHENSVICTDGTGPTDPIIYTSIVKSNEEPCLVQQPPLPYLYSSWETWMKINVFELQNTMRAAHIKSLPENSKSQVSTIYSYESIAREINGII